MADNARGQPDAILDFLLLDCAVGDGRDDGRAGEIALGARRWVTLHGSPRPATAHFPAMMPAGMLVRHHSARRVVIAAPP